MESNVFLKKTVFILFLFLTIFSFFSCTEDLPPALSISLKESGEIPDEDFVLLVDSGESAVFTVSNPSEYPIKILSLKMISSDFEAYIDGASLSSYARILLYPGDSRDIVFRLSAASAVSGISAEGKWEISYLPVTEEESGGEVRTFSFSVKAEIAASEMPAPEPGGVSFVSAPEILFFKAESGFTPLGSQWRIEAAEGAAVYYTLDGSEPDETSLLYKRDGKYVFDNGSVTGIRAVAVIGGTKSQTAAVTVSLMKPPAAPQFGISPEPEDGRFPYGAVIRLINPQPDTQVYATLDGSWPYMKNLFPESGLALTTPGAFTFRAVTVQEGIPSQEYVRDLTVSPVEMPGKPAPPTLTVEEQGLSRPPSRGYIKLSAASGMEIQYKRPGGGWEVYTGRINIKSFSNGSNTVQMRTRNPETDVYSDEVSSVFQYSDAKPTDMSRWMDHLDDSLKISRLNLPGTHESGATWDPSFALGFAQCQETEGGIIGQIEAGVRVLDLRIYKDTGLNDLYLYHGVFSMDTKLRDVLYELSQFLDENPSEFLILSVKDENGGGVDQQQWTNDVRAALEETGKLYKPGSSRDFTVGELRGKFIILRRFGYLTDCGINVTGWPNDWHDDQPRGTPPLMIQDAYNYDDSVGSASGRKQDYVSQFFSRAAQNPDDGIIYINFTSATGFSNPGFWADVMNPWLLERLKSDFNSYGGVRRYGIVMVDFILRKPEIASYLARMNDFGKYE